MTCSARSPSPASLATARSATSPHWGEGKETRSRDAALDNPHEFATLAAGIIKSKLADQLVDGIKYEKIDDWYDQTLFEQDEIIEAWKDFIVPSEEIGGVAGNHLWDGVPFESETEKTFAQGLESRKDVKLYIKFPAGSRSQPLLAITIQIGRS